MSNGGSSMVLLAGMALALAGCSEQETTPETSQEVASTVPQEQSVQPAVPQSITGTEDCKVDVLDWGPRQIVAGQPFNVQASGESSYWVNVSEESKNFEISVGGEPIQFTRSPNLVSFSHNGPFLVAEQNLDTINVDFLCGGNKVGQIQISVNR